MLRDVLRSMGWVATLVMALLASACDGEAEPRAERVVEPAPSIRSAELPRDPSADGLEVRRGDDGRISIAATDRTGRPLAITYEDATFLEAALPTLERSLSGPQIDALRRLVAEER